MSTSVSAYLNRSTPGVYINEIPAFGNNIIGIATAVPIFIGYTEVAGDPTTGASLYNTAVPISSMTEFIQYFGGPAPAQYTVTKQGNPAPPSGSGSAGTSGSSNGSVAVQQAPSFYASFADANGNISTQPFLLQPNALPGEPNQFNLYWSMQAFFANGGGDCFVVSVGSYWTNEYPTPTSLPTSIPSSWILGQIELGDPNGDPNSGNPGLNVGLTVAGNTTGPTMIVIPEACQLSSGTDGNGSPYSTLVCNMLSQASALQDRVAILDQPDCLTASTYQSMLLSQSKFSNAIAPQASSTSYGASYGPALNASIVSANDILFTNLVAANGDNSTINNILNSQARQLYGTNTAALTSVQGAIAAAFPVPAGASSQQYATGGSYPAMPTTSADAANQWRVSLDNMLLNALPVFNQIEQLIASSMNVLPPSGLLAGIWTTSDNLNGVWNAPANLALSSVISPLYAMTDSQQGGFNVPTNGETINIIRAQPTRGNVVWGARTLDGNSNDYRYIQVRRTLIYVEQSIKLALQNYVFAANDATTWAAVTAAISSFLTGVWQQGGLMGSKPSEAFSVACGLGSTMTSQNILDGYMVVAVSMQMIRPAEFIELKFTQTMGS